MISTLSQPLTTTGSLVSLRAVSQSLAKLLPAIPAISQRDAFAAEEQAADVFAPAPTAEVKHKRFM